MERKAYRESLQNNRDAILLSKQLVTIKTDVAVEFEPEAMRAQEPDPAAARALFTELEFTTLVQDFLQESVELGETDYRDAQSAAEVEAVVALAAKPGAVLAIALESAAQQTASRRRRRKRRGARQRTALTVSGAAGFARARNSARRDFRRARKGADAGAG